MSPLPKTFFLLSLNCVPPTQTSSFMRVFSWGKKHFIAFFPGMEIACFLMLAEILCHTPNQLPSPRYYICNAELSSAYTCICVTIYLFRLLSNQGTLRHSSCWTRSKPKLLHQLQWILNNLFSVNEDISQNILSFQEQQCVN